MGGLLPAKKLRLILMEKNTVPEQNDAGLNELQKWYEESYVPKGWNTINIPGYWEDQGVRNLNGVVWYRKGIEVPESMTGVPAKLFMGRIIDADVVYINGKKSETLHTSIHRDGMK